MWESIFTELWQGLLDGPTDVYIELLEFYYDAVGDDKIQKSDILNDEDLASEEFRQISSVPISEEKCIIVLEGFYKILKDMYNEQLAQKYENKLQQIFEKYNLRYTIMNNCRIGLSIQGALDSMLLMLKKTIQNDPQRLQDIKDLEENISKL